MDNCIRIFEGILLFSFFFFVALAPFVYVVSVDLKTSCFSFTLNVIVYIWKKSKHGRNICWSDNPLSLYFVRYISVLGKNSVWIYCYIYYAVFSTKNLFRYASIQTKCLFKFTMCSLRLNHRKKTFSFH